MKIYVNFIPGTVSLGLDFYWGLYSDEYVFGFQFLVWVFRVEWKKI